MESTCNEMAETAAAANRAQIEQELLTECLGGNFEALLPQQGLGALAIERNSHGVDRRRTASGAV